MWFARLSMMRYVYLDDRQTDPGLRRQPCDPIRDARGRCVVSRSRQLVRFADGRRIVVNRRMLRLAKPPDIQRWEYAREGSGWSVRAWFEGDVTLWTPAIEPSSTGSSA
jgi:hypothetical protein